MDDQKTTPPAGPPEDREVLIGRRLARWVFQQRGNHSEVHLQECQLVALLSWAAMEGALAQAKAGLARLEVVDKNQEPDQH